MRKIALASFFILGCGKGAEPQDASSRGTPTPSASIAATAPTASSVAPAASSAKPDVVDAGAPDAAPPKPVDEPPPKVKIVTIGMHVAGGPFDEPTKVPFKKAVEPHFKELARCWRLVTKPRTADAGVDLLIEPNGGKPKVSNPRASIEGEGFLPCVVAFFESIEFEKPQNGRTGVSYSVRFKP